MSQHQKLVDRLLFSHSQHNENQAEKLKAKWFCQTLSFLAADSAPLHLEANNFVLRKIHTHMEKNREG